MHELEASVSLMYHFFGNLFINSSHSRLKKKQNKTGESLVYICKLILKLIRKEAQPKIPGQYICSKDQGKSDSSGH